MTTTVKTGTRHIVTRIQELFQEALKVKTGWGRNEVLEIHTICVNQALMEALDAQENPSPPKG